jgi:GDPmannose 4,6-dehydratase
LRRAAGLVDPIGDPRRAEELLGWRPTTTFADLIEEMVCADLESLE